MKNQNRGIRTSIFSDIPMFILDRFFNSTLLIKSEMSQRQIAEKSYKRIRELISKSNICYIKGNFNYGS